MRNSATSTRSYSLLLVTSSKISPVICSLITNHKFHDTVALSDKAMFISRSNIWQYHAEFMTHQDAIAMNLADCWKVHESISSCIHLQQRYAIIFMKRLVSEALKTTTNHYFYLTSVTKLPTTLIREEQLSEGFDTKMANVPLFEMSSLRHFLIEANNASLPPHVLLRWSSYVRWLCKLVNTRQWHSGIYTAVLINLFLSSSIVFSFLSKLHLSCCISSSYGTLFVTSRSAEMAYSRGNLSANLTPIFPQDLVTPGIFYFALLEPQRPGDINAWWIVLRCPAESLPQPFRDSKDMASRAYPFFVPGRAKL